MAYGQFKEIQSPYFATGNPATEEMTTLYAPGMLGCIAQFDQGGISGPANICVYQLVKQNSAITGVVGNVMYWVSKGSTFVITTVSTNTGHVAGVCEIAAGTAASYIWILKKGDRNVLFIDAPTSAPDATGKPVVGVTATAGKADALLLATAPQPILFGRTLGAQDGTSKLALVRVNVGDQF